MRALAGWLLLCLLLGPAAAQDPTNSTAIKPAALSPAATNRFENSLGMRFVPVPGVSVLFSVWETRVQDYTVFLEATGRAWTQPPFDQGPTHPIVNVNWDDARTFCEWLTVKERKARRLTDKQKYRLPTDREWSAAVGLGPEHGKMPEERMKSYIVWPWGAYWPPLSGDGNFAPELKADDMANTAPVGSFTPNAFGLYDLAGNVWEWSGDWYSEARVSMALRGGSFNDGQPAYLLAAYRFNATMNLVSEDIGFRVVLETSE